MSRQQEQYNGNNSSNPLPTFDEYGNINMAAMQENRKRLEELRRRASTREVAPFPPPIPTARVTRSAWGDTSDAQDTASSAPPPPHPERSATAQPRLSTGDAANAMRLLMKAYRDSQKVWPRGKGASVRNGWRREAFGILGVSEYSNNLMRDIQNKISHLNSIYDNVEAHYSRGSHMRESAINSRAFQASQLFNMIKRGDNDVLHNELDASDSRKSAAVYNQINNGNIIEQERSRRGATSQVVRLHPQVQAPGNLPTSSRTAARQPDTVEQFIARVNNLPAWEAAKIQAAHQQQSHKKRTTEKEVFGGDAFEDWLKNFGKTRELIRERIEFFSENSALINQDPKNNRQLREMFVELSGIVDNCCKQEYITESESAIDNVANAFRGYFQGLNLSLSSDICRKFLSYEISKTPHGSDKMSALLICKNSIDDGLLGSRARAQRPVIPARRQAVEIPGAIDQLGAANRENDVYDLLDKLVQGFKEKDIKHVFFDLDDTLIKHAIKDMNFMSNIFGSGVGQYTSSDDPRSYAHPDRQGFYHDRAKRKEIADRVTDPELVRNFMYALADEGIKVHINTLNSSTLAKVLCEEHDWPAASISAADGQIADYRSNPRGLNTAIKTEGSPRKIAATARIVGGEQNLRQVAFFDDDFSKFSPTCNYLEAKGAMCFMKSEQKGVRFDSNHPDFEKELKEKLEELQKRSPATTPARPGTDRIYSRAHLQATTR